MAALADMAEFIAIAETLKHLKFHQLTLPICSESATAIKWVMDR